MRAIPVEICIDCSEPRKAIQSAENALSGGAARLELCSSMDCGGMTPDADTVKNIHEIAAGRAELLVMIRSRPGDFEYTSDEIQRMAQEIEQAATLGIDGVVFGAIVSGRVDTAATNQLTQMAHTMGLRVTFHRAFDALPDWKTALETLIELGVDRILTSGTRWNDPTAHRFDGAILSQISQRAQGRIELVLAGGISDSNVSELLAYVNGGPSAPVSVHAYSSVRLDGITDKAKVAGLVDSTRRFAQHH